jgi:hypothetical protein
MSKLPDITQKRWVRNVQLSRYFNISAMCLWRWKRDAALKCPPSYVVNDIEYNDIAAWEKWMLSRAVNHFDGSSENSTRSERFKRARRSA